MEWRSGGQTAALPELLPPRNPNESTHPGVAPGQRSPATQRVHKPSFPSSLNTDFMETAVGLSRPSGREGHHLEPPMQFSLRVPYHVIYQETAVHKPPSAPSRPQTVLAPDPPHPSSLPPKKPSCRAHTALTPASGRSSIRVARTQSSL